MAGESLAESAALFREQPVMREPASANFRFRFVSRGEKANSLAPLAIRSLRICHPGAAITLVDANDFPAFGQAAGIDDGVNVVHVPPGEDDIARAVGRGSRVHMFYWRHSPQVMAALPPPDSYAVYADADIIFLRPMDLAALISPLEAGRIAAAVDESSIDYFGRLAAAMPQLGRIMPAAAPGGPLLQAGLLATNPRDDGGIYQRFWELAGAAARAGLLAELPFDDMCLLSTLLGHGGPLWHRLLPLGHEWNYITDARKDPGVFGCGAHYGGHRAKAFILDRRARLLAPFGAGSCWGTVPADPGTARELVRGIVQRPSADPDGEVPVLFPFCLSWAVPPGDRELELTAALPCAHQATFFVYTDGRLADRVHAGEGRAHARARWTHAEVVTVIGVSSYCDCQARLRVSFRC